LPLKTGFRFSRKALTPSILSSVEKQMAKRSTSRLRPSSRFEREASLTASFASWSAIGAFSAILLAISKVLFFEFFGGMNVVYEAERVGCGCVDHIAGKNHFHRFAFTDEFGQPLGAAAAGDDAEVDLGLAKAGLFAGDADVACECDLAAAAETKTVDHRDDGFRKDVDLIEQCSLEKSAALGDGRLALEFADIGTGDKGFRPRAGDHDNADFRIIPERVERSNAFFVDFVTECVKFIGTVDG
jgi:hypothetical protein